MSDVAKYRRWQATLHWAELQDHTALLDVPENDWHTISAEDDGIFGKAGVDVSRLEYSQIAADSAFENSIDPSLVAAFRATHFDVNAPHPFTLRYGEPSGALRQLMLQWGVTSAAYVTAWNPFGKASDPSQNEVCQDALRAELRGSGFVIIEGEGRDPTGAWPPEPSLLVLGIADGPARRLGHRYQQAAILFAGEDAVPELVLLVGLRQPGFTESLKGSDND